MFLMEIYKINLFLFLFKKNRHTFIDLAQIVCKQPEMRFEKRYSSSSDEDFDGYISEPTTLVNLLIIYL